MKNKNKKRRLFLFLILLSAGFFGFWDNSDAGTDPATESYNGLSITEIMYNPRGSNTEHSKWVELKNLSTHKIILEATGNKTASGWKIKDLKISDSSNHYLYNPTNNNLEISPDKYLIITDNVTNFENDYPGLKDVILLKSAIALTTSTGDYSLSLFNNSVILDYLSYTKEWGADDNGNSLEKINLGGNDSKDNWHESCISGGTPSKKNSEKEDCKKEDMASSAESSELEKNDLKLSVEIKSDKNIYPGMYANFEAGLTDAKNNPLHLARIGKSYQYACNISLTQACDSPTLKFTWNFGDAHKSYLLLTRHKYGQIGTYDGSLIISDGSKKTVKNFIAVVSKFPDFKLQFIAVSPNPKGKDAKHEWLEIKNKSKKKVNLKDWSIATGWKKISNHPIKKDFIIKPNKTKKITSKFSSFTLNNKESKIELRNPVGEVVDKIKYSAKTGILEDATYEKLRNKWQWFKPQISAGGGSASGGNTNEIQANTTENIVPQKIEISPEDLGKQSLDETKTKNRIVLANYGTHLNLPADLASQPRVLGAETVRENNNFYAFSRPAIPEKHWLIQFIENIGMATNFWLNKFILLFSS